MMQPLKITAYVAGSIALARPEDLALDGILAYQVLRRHFGDEFYLLPDPKEVLFFARLPLEMRGKPSERVQGLKTGDLWIGDKVGTLDIVASLEEQHFTSMRETDESLWYWSVSSAQIAVKGRDTIHWNKRFDTQAALSDHIDFGGRVEKILIEQGRYKAYHMPLPLLVTDKVVWYAYGEMEPIADMLCPIAALGHKRVQGNGAVLRWTIEPMGEDWSEWHDGTLMRPIPGPLAQNITPLDIQYIAFRAPQWHKANQCMCVTKGVRNG